MHSQQHQDQKDISYHIFHQAWSQCRNNPSPHLVLGAWSWKEQGSLVRTIVWHLSRCMYSPGPFYAALPISQTWDLSDQFSIVPTAARPRGPPVGSLVEHTGSDPWVNLYQITMRGEQGEQ